MGNSIKFLDDEQLLDINFRKLIIDEMINNPENIKRKNISLRAHEVYRDQVKKWLMHALMNEGYKRSTLNQMYNRATNINICKKIVNKRAVIYKGGVARTTQDEMSTMSISELVDEMDFNTKMVTVNAFLELHNNCMILVAPQDSMDELISEDHAKKDIKFITYAPYQYDVIPFHKNRTEAAVLITTDFHERYDTQSMQAVNELDGVQGIRSPGSTSTAFSSGDGINQMIADSPADEGRDRREFIWWSTKYHFTTNERGEIITELSPADLLNPTGIRNFINICGEQDNSFWAIGGDDKVSETISINKKLTDAAYLQFTQGFGQLVISGKDIPKILEGGPDNALIFERVSSDDPAPEVFFATSNPNIDAWYRAADSHIALLLSVNNLSPSTVSSSLNVNNTASGIALLIDQSELTTDLLEEQELFRDKEPLVWEVIRRWHELLSVSGELTEAFSTIPTFSDSNVNLKFMSFKAPISEKERLEQIKMRKDLKLNTAAELLQLDNPDLTDDEAAEKLEEINAESMQKAAAFGLTMGGNAPQTERVDGVDSAADSEEDSSEDTEELEDDVEDKEEENTEEK